MHATDTNAQAAATQPASPPNLRARLARLRYDQGASPYLDVLDAERDLLSAEQQLVQGREALLSTQVALYAALGGGYFAQGQSSAPTPAALQP